MSQSTRFLTTAFITAIGSFSASAQGNAGLIQRLDSIVGAEVRANRSVGIVEIGEMPGAERTLKKLS